MARLRYLQNKRSGAAGTISKADKRIYFFDENAYIYASSSGVLNVTATTLNLTGALASTGAQTFDDIVTVTNTLGANENGMTLAITAPLVTVLHNWTAAQTIDITQSSRIGAAASPAWSARGRLMAGDYDVNINDTVTNVFGVIAKINILNTMNATANNDTNDVQALAGFVNINAPSGTTLQSQTTSTMCGVKGGVSRSQSGGITLDHNVYAGVFTYNMDGSTVSGNNGILELYNYGSDTCDAGIYIHPFGTLTVGIELDNADAGVFTTGISIDSCTTANLAIQGTNATGINMTGTYSSNGIEIETIPAAAMNGVYSHLTASAAWTSNNICAFRGRVAISTTTGVSSATGVWAGIDITSDYNGNGLVAAINAEISSTKATCPNAIVYIQSLPAATAADFSNVPYLVFSETVTNGTGSNILFEVGHLHANTAPTVGSGLLLHENTLQIAVSESAGTRLARYLPILTAQVDLNDPSSKFIIYVNEDTGVASGTQDGTFHRPYDEIQDAVLKVIANADNTDAIPYTIMVGPGTYTTTIDLANALLFNLSIISIGGPHSVIVNPGSGNAMQCSTANDNLHYLYVKGIDFWQPINFLGADNDTDFLVEECIFEDCMLCHNGVAAYSAAETMLTLNNVNRFYWQNGCIHVMDSISITNVHSCGIRGEGYRDLFPITGAPGTTTLVAATGSNHPVDMDDDRVTYNIRGAYVQRKEPDITVTLGIVRYWLRNAYCGLATGLTIPENAELYAHNSTFPGSVTLASGSVAKLYKSHIRDTFTDSGADLTIYGTTEGEALTVAS